MDFALIKSPPPFAQSSNDVSCFQKNEYSELPKGFRCSKINVLSRYVNFVQLLSPIISQRQEALDALQRCSLYASTLDVTPEDQLLLLITCVEDDALRRVVCARRIRTDETEDELAGIARRTAVK